MLVDDDRAFSLVIPNKDGQPFLKRTLDYLVSQQYSGRISICDSSEGIAREFVGQCQENYPDLWLEVTQYPAETSLLNKLCDTLRGIQSELVLLHANDDFMVPVEVSRCVEVMAKDSGLSAARGRIALFKFDAAENDNLRFSVALYPYPMRAYLQTDPVTRALSMLEHYSATFYSVHRRHLLLENFAMTENTTKNVIFFQYLSSMLMALQGRIWCGDRLFYARQAHASSMSVQMRRSDYEHWPLLITSSNFSRYYQEFRAAVCRWAQAKLGIGEDGFGLRIDRAAADGLFTRGYCQRESEIEEEERRFMTRLNDSTSDDCREFKRVVEFASRYPETIL
jgi:glycosyltransferase domain-containing protein